MTRETLKIVVADNSAIVRERLMVLLSEIAGLTVVGEAEDAQATIECISILKPDVVILDYSLAQENGIRFLRLLAQDILSSYKPILIVLTNNDAELLRPEVLAAGAALLLDKSYDLDSMTDFLRLMV